MEVIRDWKKLKQLVDPNYTYSCVGYSRGLHLFDFTHEHLYKYSVGMGQKLLCVIWDNYHDINVFRGIPTKISEYDEENAIKWLSEKKFDYLFLPDKEFIYELFEDEIFKQVRKEIDEIWIKEGYEPYLCNWSIEGNTAWVKLVLSRHYFLYTDRSGSKFINRCFQAVSPEGTWGFLYKHFWEKYCSGTYKMVPILRNKNGLAYDVSFKTYPPEVVEVFSKMVPFFNKFRNDNDIDNLSKNIDDLVLRSIKYKLDSFTHVNNEITMNKSIISIIIRDRKTKQLYRVWDYGNGI
jgi:hypothetical protein